MDPRSQFGPNAEKYLTSSVHSNQSALAHLVHLVQPRGGTVLDVATGAGHTAYAFAPYVDQMIASDITPDMLRVTRNSAKERGLNNFEVIFALAEDLPFRPNSLEGITCRLGSHHFSNAARFVQEAARSLAKDGWFLLVDTIGSEEPESDELVDKLERVRDPSHVRNLRRSEWLRMVQAAGMRVVHEEIGPREIDAEDWMERMNVSEPDRVLLRDLIRGASGEFRSYLSPRETDGRLIFDLQEIVLIAKRKNCE